LTPPVTTDISDVHCITLVVILHCRYYSVELVGR